MTLVKTYISCSRDSDLHSSAPHWLILLVILYYVGNLDCGFFRLYFFRLWGYLDHSGSLDCGVTWTVG